MLQSRYKLKKKLLHLICGTALKNSQQATRKAAKPELVSLPYVEWLAVAATKASNLEH